MHTVLTVPCAFVRIRGTNGSPPGEPFALPRCIGRPLEDTAPGAFFILQRKEAGVWPGFGWLSLGVLRCFGPHA